MAKSPTKEHLLAFVGPFSLVFWMSAQPTRNMLSIDVPKHDWGFFGTDGIVKKVDRSASSDPQVQIHPGPSGKAHHHER